MAISKQPSGLQHAAKKAQLLAKEKWLIEALNKIRARLQDLQIERLHLESLREQTNASLNLDHTNVGSTAPTTSAEAASSGSCTQPNMFTADNTNVNHSALDPDDTCNMELNRDTYCTPCDEEEDMENGLTDMDMSMSGK